MFLKEKKVLSEIAKVLSAEPSVLKIIAYGSRVRGDFRYESDLDIFILVEKKTRVLKDKIIETFYDYEMKSGISFSVTVLSKEEFDFNDSIGSPFIESIKTEGVVIYDSRRRGEKVSIPV